MSFKSDLELATILHKHTHNLFKEYCDELRQLLAVLPEVGSTTKDQIVKVIKTLEEIRRIEEKH
jgi:hypothetical protein